MNEESKQIALREIEENRARLIEVVNSKMDEARRIVLSGEASGKPNEIIYPLTVMPELFKGSKPTALIFGDERVPVKKWRTVYIEILKRCCADALCHDRLMGLRNRVHGRSRTIISDKPDGMDVAVEVCEGLYAEADFDTGSLIRMLTTGILDPAGYDYSGISVAVLLR